MNAFDYRIQSRKDQLRGRIVRVMEANGARYADVRMNDGRLFRYVRVLLPSVNPPTVQAGDLVSLSRVGGRWVADLR